MSGMSEQGRKSEKAQRAKRIRMQRSLIMVEILSMLFLALFIFVLTRNRVKDDVSVQALEGVILEAVSSAEIGWQKADYEKLREYYGLNENEYEGVCLYTPASNMDASELLLIKLKDEAQATDVQSAVEKRLENQKGKFENYGMEQMGILNRAEIEIKAPYILFAVCDKSEEIRKVFLDTVLK